MRKQTKQQITDILSSMLELQEACSALSSDDLITAMQDCQQAAIAIGDMLCDSMEEQKLIPLLEKYCEEAYHVAMAAQEPRHDLSAMNQLVHEMMQAVKAIIGTYQIIFFPYKADMWDSLESVWRACKEDPRCECLVVPIPYFRRDTIEQQWIPCYDGDRFPADVPVVPYEEYSVSQERPDVAFVHNPYDDANYVTRIHPAYFSRELKKHVGKLIYIPYYVTVGRITVQQKYLPIHCNMDYMIAQSEFYRSGCKRLVYYDNTLPLGSPKLDKVIRLCKEKPQMPVEWQEVLAGNKTLMLNTSLSHFLYWGELHLQKLRRLFEWLKDREGIKLVWRPHPLFESTIRSLRPDMLQVYTELVEYFESARIGVIDTTSDVSATVALVDGYLGEEASSVVNLFGAAGKPLFILNDFVMEQSDAEAVRKLRIYDMCFADGKWWLVSNHYNGLFTLEDDWNRLGFVGRVEKEPKWCGTYAFLGTDGRQLFMSPNAAKCAVSYDAKRGFEALETCEEPSFRSNRHVIAHGQSVFYLPGGCDEIREYRPKEKRWKLHEAPIDALKEGVEVEKYRVHSRTYAYAQTGAFLWIVALYTNKVLCFNMENGEYGTTLVGESDWGYSGILAADGYVWLAEAKSGVLVRWNIENGVVRVTAMPKELTVRNVHTNGHMVVHQAVLDAGRYVVLTPAFSNALVRVEKETGKAKIWLPELWEHLDEACSDYHPNVHHAVGFAKKVQDNHLWIQRTRDAALVDIDLATESYTIHYPKLSEEAFATLLDGQDGFERRLENYSPFARYESGIFPMENFVEELLSGRLEAVKARQLEELSDFAANLDGTCGEKVHEFVMKMLEESGGVSDA